MKRDRQYWTNYINEWRKRLERASNERIAGQCRKHIEAGKQQRSCCAE